MDIIATNHGTLIGLSPATGAGEDWLTDNLPDDVQTMGSTRFCEPRYAKDIVDGMMNDGLEVS